MTVIHVDFRAHTAARRVPSPQGLAEGARYDATWRFWRASTRAMEAHNDRRRHWPGVRSLWDILDYALSDRLRCAAGGTLATLRESDYPRGYDPYRGAL